MSSHFSSATQGSVPSRVPAGEPVPCPSQQQPPPPSLSSPSLRGGGGGNIIFAASPVPKITRSVTGVPPLHQWSRFRGTRQCPGDLLLWFAKRHHRPARDLC